MSRFMGRPLGGTALRVALVGTLLVVSRLAAAGAAPTLLAQSRHAEVSALRKLIEEGQAAARAGEGAKAMKCFDPAVTLSEQLGDEESLAHALAGLGWAKWTAGDYAESLELRRRALGLYRKRGEAAGEATMLRHIGETFFSLGRYEEALEQYRLALESQRRAPDPSGEALTLSSMGSAYRRLGRLSAALEVLERSHEIARRAGAQPAVIQALIFLGIVSRAQGEYDRALQYYAEALELERETGNRRAESQTLGNMANVYADIGLYERAIELDHQALSLAQEIGYTPQVAFSTHHIALVLSGLGRAREALAGYEAALALWRKIGRQAEVSATLRDLGSLRLFQLNDVAGAREALLESLEVARAVGEPAAEALAQVELAAVERRAGNAPAALERLDAALAIARGGRDPDLEYRVRAARGQALSEVGRGAEAIDELRASARIVNDLRANVSSDDAKIAFVDSRQEVFHELAGVLLAAERPEEALEAVEAGHARAFADLLEQRQVRGKPDQREALAALRTSLDEARAAPARAASAESTSASASPGDVSARGQDALDEWLARLRSAHRELASLVTAESPNIAEVKQIAARLRATFVEYLVTERQVLAWVVSSEGEIHAVRIEAGRERIEADVKSLRRAIDHADLAALRDPGRLRPQLKSLDRLLIAPLARWLPSSPDALVVVIPHGSLALLPFAALENDAGLPLAVRHTLAFAPAAAVFRYTPDKRRAPPAGEGRTLVVSDPTLPPDAALPSLPGAREEGRSVAARMGPARTTWLSRERASEAAVKREAARHHILHFAAHGLISETRPVDSSLLLAAGEGDDGYLRVGEVFGLELAADLTVLSGCSTGLGRLSGDGIVGLCRAFLYAGTPTVVVSLWDVSDRATAILMDRFYAELRAGKGKAGALRSAQLATRRRFPHPALWAAFNLVGEPQ